MTNPLPTTSQTGRGSVRIVLLLTYLAGMAALVVYECAAWQVLGKARELQSRAKPSQEAAVFAYRVVLEQYPWSSATWSARDELRTLAGGLPPTCEEPAVRRTWLEQAVGPILSPYTTDQLPLAACGIASVTLAVAALCRVRRRNFWAGGCFILMLISVVGGILFCQSAGVIHVSWLERPAIKLAMQLRVPQYAHRTSWMAVGAAALMTLTPAKRR